jgi:hypothetical protein
LAIKGRSFSGTFNPRKLSHPNELIVVDWMGPIQPSTYGYQYILLIVDAFTSYAIGTPYRFKSSEATADGLLSWIGLFGKPSRWSSDNDSTFVSNTIVTLRKMLNISDDISPTYCPVTQGVVERLVRTIKEGISSCLYHSDVPNPIDWPLILKACLFNSNSLPRSHGFSPFELLFGRPPVDPLQACLHMRDYDVDTSDDRTDYLASLQERISVIHEYWQSKSMELKNGIADQQCDGVYAPLQSGDRCLRIAYINGHRQDLGQVIIIEPSGTNSYVVETANGEHTLVHGYQLIKIFEHPFRDTTPSLVSEQIEPEYFQVAKVLQYDPSKGYLVSWDGYDSSHDSWQKPSDMPSGCRHAMSKARQRYQRSK